MSEQPPYQPNGPQPYQPQPNQPQWGQQPPPQPQQWQPQGYPPPGPPPQNPYGGPPPYGAYHPGAPDPDDLPHNKGNGLALSALVIGIVAVLFCWTIIGGILFGLAAVVLGFMGRSQVKKGLTHAGAGMGLAGIILGLIGAALSIILVIVGIGIFKSTGGDDYVDCINKAGSDKTAQQNCTDDFKKHVEDKFGVDIGPTG